MKQSLKITMKTISIVSLLFWGCSGPDKKGDTAMQGELEENSDNINPVEEDHQVLNQKQKDIEKKKREEQAFSSVATRFYAKLDFYSPGEHINRAAFALLERPATKEEMDQAIADGSIDKVLSGYLEDPRFLNVLEAQANEKLYRLQELPGAEDAVNTISNNAKFPNAKWYGANTGNRNCTNTALLRSQGKLLRYVVESNKPISEVLTTNGIMVNYCSARSLGLTVDFDAANDANEYKLAEISGYPLAGNITNPVFLGIQAATEFNYSRQRSNRIQCDYADHCVEKIGNRPVDDEDELLDKFENPVKQAASCNQCHATLDQTSHAMMIAGWHSNANDFAFVKRQFDPTLYSPGILGIELPEDQYDRAGQWLAETIVKDLKPRKLFDGAVTYNFSPYERSMVKHLYYWYFQRAEVGMPFDLGDPNFDTRLQAYALYNNTIGKCADALNKSKGNLKEAVRCLINSEEFRARDVKAEHVSSFDPKVFDEFSFKLMLTPVQTSNAFQQWSVAGCVNNEGANILTNTYRQNFTPTPSSLWMQVVYTAAFRCAQAAIAASGINTDLRPDSEEFKNYIKNFALTTTGKALSAEEVDAEVKLLQEAGCNSNCIRDYHAAQMVKAVIQ